MPKLEGYRLPQVQANPDKLYAEYLPGQSEHILRLIAERLQYGLRKSNPEPLSPSEIEQLAGAFYSVYSIWKEEQQ